MMNSSSSNLRRPSPIEAYNVRQKGKRITGSPSSPSSLSIPKPATPLFFGEFVRTCGGPSSNDEPLNVQDGGVSSSSSSNGCFGIRFGGVGAAAGAAAAGAAADPAEENEEATALIAKAMNHLSLQERELAYEDLHGVSAQVHETPELMAQTLKEMERSIQGIRHKPAYDMALTLRASYVQDPKLRLLFLRADRFDAPKAAQRLVKFMEYKLNLFGPEKLCQWHIGLADLDHNARYMVESGWYQILPARDSRGRIVFIIASNYHLKLHRTTLATMQMIYYIYQCAAEDEINQINGCTCVAYCLGPEEVYQKAEDRNRIGETINLAHCLPLRIDANHFCTANHGMKYAMSLVAKSLGILHRARLRIHFGSPLEIEYALMAFGLPSSLLPFTSTAELKTGNHKKWFDRRVLMEQALPPGGEGNYNDVFSGIELPGRQDVLLGQGKPMQHHPGNQRLQELSLLYLEEYNQAHRNGGRAEVALKIVHEIQNPCSQNPRGNSSNNGSLDGDGGGPPLLHLRGGGGGGRFLKRRDDKSKNGWWEGVTDEEVLIDKVCSALRGVRKRTKDAAALDKVNK
jgi:hypothetical protein